MTATQYTVPQVIFENRRDAGVKLAAELADYANQSAVVLAIPNGGVPVALEVASALKAGLELIIVRKIPLPLNPEAGLGAVVDDGTIVLNDEAVRHYGLTSEQIEYEAGKVRENVKQRSIKDKGNWPLARISGRTAIIVDDGLASGITMRAAVESLRHRRPKELVVAVPVAAAAALSQVEKVADKVVTCAIADVPKFYIADFYRQWRDLSDDEVLRLLEQWRFRLSRR